MNGIISEVQGRLSHDPELRYTSQGTAMLVLNVAVEDSKRAEDAPTEWVRVTCWEELAERLAERLRKGSEVYCHGRLKLRTWEKQDGSQGAGVEMSAWTVQSMGVGRQAPRREDGADPARRREPPEQPRRMPAIMAAVGGQSRSVELNLEDVPF